jgi:protein involved in polysaccharide export with SLBB domain
MNPLTRLSLFAACAALLAGCENNQLPVARQGIPSPEVANLDAAPAQPIDPSLLKPSANEFRLGPGDELHVEVADNALGDADVTVGPDGKVYYEFLPGIDVEGLSLAEARSRFENELGRYTRDKPQVSLTLRRVVSQKYWMLGRLSSPGVYTLDQPTTLLEAVAGAGGLGVSKSLNGPNTEPADLSRSFLIRDGRFVPVDFERLLREGDLSQNVYLQPDDFIFVPSARSAQVHVLGAVLQPRSERFSGSLTVVQAIALAGGSVPDACLPNVAILRGSLAHPQIAIVAVNEVLHGKAADVRLAPGDIVYVPYKPERVLTRYVNLVLDTFVRTVGVNEGAYAISSKAAPITVGVNLTP